MWSLTQYRRAAYRDAYRRFIAFGARSDYLRLLTYTDTDTEVPEFAGYLRAIR